MPRRASAALKSIFAPRYNPTRLRSDCLAASCPGARHSSDQRGWRGGIGGWREASGRPCKRRMRAMRMVRRPSLPNDPSWSRDHEDGGPTIRFPAANGRCTLDEVAPVYALRAFLRRPTLPCDAGSCPQGARHRGFLPSSCSSSSRRVVRRATRRRARTSKAIAPASNPRPIAAAAYGAVPPRR